MDARAALAARNNAEWCDAVCRAHGITTSFGPHVWVALRRSPPMHPDAMTLTEYASAGDVLRRVDGSSGCSIKDSFGSLDFAHDGFGPLFDAEWVHREPSRQRADDSLSWSVVRTPDELVAWGAAHGGGDVLGPVLLDDPAVTILMARDGQGVSAGAIGYRSRSVVGVSNLFTATSDIDQAWAGAITVISAQNPDLPLVGYENGTSLRAARRAGFVSVGPLRVWLKD
jgi:hypothetical protein